MGLRIVVVDDNPHVRFAGRVYPVNATFHRFLSAVLDVPGVDSIVHAVPVRDVDVPPRTLPLDARLEVVATAPFDGIAGFLRHAPSITRRNLEPLRAAIRGADLVWIKVPASNALVATILARQARVPRFVWVAGNARDVVAGQQRSRLAGAAARLVATAYDGIGDLAATGGDRVVVGDEFVASLVEPSELRRPRERWPRDAGRLRLVWAGRLAAGKGVETLLEATALLERTTTLALLGDGPERADLERHSRRLGVASRTTFAGYVADRAPYLERLAAADLFVAPSPAEGFPKVVLDAMAVGLPVVAVPSGGLRAAVDAGIVQPVPAGDPAALAEAIRALAADPPRAKALAEAGAAFVARHTAPAEAARLVARWQARLARRRR